MAAAVRMDGWVRDVQSIDRRHRDRSWHVWQMCVIVSSGSSPLRNIADATLQRNLSRDQEVLTLSLVFQAPPFNTADFLLSRTCDWSLLVADTTLQRLQNILASTESA